MANEDVTVQDIFLVDESGAAIKIYLPFRNIWLPRSQVSYMHKKAKTSDGRELVIKIPEWLAKKHNLKYE